MPHIFHRYIEQRLDALVPFYRGFHLYGLKQIGKTTTLLPYVTRLYRGDSLQHFQMLFPTPEHSVRQNVSFAIIEWQVLQNEWYVLRYHLRYQRHPRKLFITTSHLPSNLSISDFSTIHLPSLHIRPLSIPERDISEPSIDIRALMRGHYRDVKAYSSWTFKDYFYALCSTGFPSLQGLSSSERNAQLSNYLRSLINSAVSPTRHCRKETISFLWQWLNVYAAASSTPKPITAVTKQAFSSTPYRMSMSSVRRYFKTFIHTWLLEPMPAWCPLHESQLHTSALVKHYFSDPGIAAYLLGIAPHTFHSDSLSDSHSPNENDINSALFESFAALSFRVFADMIGARVYHFRSRDCHHHVDFVVDLRDGSVLLVEVVFQPVIVYEHVRDLLWLRRQLSKTIVNDCVVVYPGHYAYRRSDGIAVIPLACLGIFI
ncbi:MAG: DUF4143 domain-containing protein [Actinomycetaceae bacterium]|nr:DUF4143 domain-containing protein [Actinomycetaceae bacterium]